MNIAQILMHIRPLARWALSGNDYEGLEWLDDEQPKPTEQELADAWPRVEALERNAFAERKRAGAYAQEADPLFFYWQSGEGTKAAWLAKRAEIRAKFPYVEVPE